MSTRKKSKRRADTSDTIASTIEQHKLELLPAIEGALDPQIRQSLTRGEKPAWARYGRCFEAVMKALGSNKGATRWLFELDCAVGEIAEAQGQLSRAVGMAGGLSLSERYLSGRPVHRSSRLPKLASLPR